MDKPLLSEGQVQALTRIWQKTQQPNKGGEDRWNNDIGELYDLGIGLQETLQYLYSAQPDKEQFIQWIIDNRPTVTAVAEYEAAVLSAADLAHWHEHGYVVVKEAVSQEEHLAANKAIWQFLEADPTDPKSWYKEHPAMSGMMVVLTQHEALQTIRNAPRIRKAFEQLYGTRAIRKVVDKVSFNPPQNQEYRFRGSALHWDTSLVLPIPDLFQGLVYLNDVTENGGAFTCVPGFHRHLAQWINSAPAGSDLRMLALQTLTPIPVPGNAGDMIIWHQALPHCASPNNSSEPRLVQYLTYVPDNYNDNREWK